MIVLITGASVGFGEAMARRFASAGHRVIALARRLDKLETLQRDFGDLILPLALDVQDTAAIQSLVKALPENWQAIDVLINNAGLALGVEPAHQASLDEWETMIDTNVRGLVAMTRAVLPGMVARHAGLIINLGSTAGAWPYPGGNVYGATKAFVTQFTRNLRADLVGSGVRATTIAPGMAGGTEFSNVRYRGDDDAAAKVYSEVQPLRAQDIAETAYWIATLPPHVNVNFIELMPECQGFGPLAVKRGG